MTVSFLTLKNLYVFLLAGIMLYPIGINSSYAQTDPARAIGDTLDLMGIANYNPSCTEFIFAVDRFHTVVEIFPLVGTNEYSLGELDQDPAPCFEGNTRTWQAFVINADDYTILYSTDPVTTSDVADVHNLPTDFSGLEKNTDYRAVLLLTGAYSTNHNDLANYPYVDDTTVFGIYPFTTGDLGYAPDITLQALTASAGTLDIPFSQLLDNAVDIHRVNLVRNGFAPSYADSDITLSLQTADASIYDSITGVTGVTVDPGNTGSADTFIVNAGTVTISTGLDSTYNSDIHFDYTVTGNTGPFDGHTDTGVITIKFVDVIQNIVAIPYTLDADADPLRIIPRIFTALYISESLQDHAGPNDNAKLNRALRSLDLTITDTGSASGTLEVTNFRHRADFVYTPAAGFTGTETFPYTATFEGVSSSSVINIVSPTVCAASLVSGINFGTLDVGETSDIQYLVVNNDGTKGVELFMKGDNWKSADGKDTMNVGQTKYTSFGSFSESYADRTALTSTSADLGITLSGRITSTTFAIQLLIDLLDDSFRGVTSQELTIGVDCTRF